MTVFLRLLGRGISLVTFAVIITGAIRLIFLIVLTVFGFIFLIIFDAVRIIAQLVCIPHVTDQLTGKFGKRLLIRQRIFQTFQRAAAMIFDKATPQFHDVISTLGQITASGQMTDHISGSSSQRGVSSLVDLIVTLAHRFTSDLGVNIASGTGHILCTNGLNPGGFHGLIQVLRHLAMGHISGGNLGVVELMAQGKGICGATG